MTALSLSIDGVGLWSLLEGPKWTIGGAGTEADVRFMAPMEGRVAEITLEDGHYWFREGGPPADTGGHTEGNDAAQRRAALRDGARLTLAGGVGLVFRRPHPWSRAATLEWLGPRPVSGSDGAVLWGGPCVLGPEPDSHVCCDDWGEAVALFRWDEQTLWRRLDAAGPGEVNRLAPGTLIETDAGRVLVS